jgi:hypothetical protein
MSHLEIILPFCIPPATLTTDLLRELRTPAFATLIAFAKRGETEEFDEFSRLLPHESLLAGHFKQVDSKTSRDRTPAAKGKIADSDLLSEKQRRSSPADTHNKMRALGITPADGFWFTLNPVHIQIARNHLVLNNQSKLIITELESRALFKDASEIVSETGKTLVYGDEKVWFVRADDWQALQTSSMDAASGHNIEIWQPEGEHARVWRKLQNEIQMQWFIHDVNGQRESRGEPLINSVWLQGGSAELSETPSLVDSARGVETVISQMQESGKSTLLLDALLDPALNNDWAGWIDAMHKLEQAWFVPLLGALKDKKITRISLIASNANCMAPFTLNARSLWKFWTKPSLDQLFFIPAE